MSAPTAISLFAGIGGFDLGLERAGFQVVAQVENDPFCQRVLAARWPHTERVGGVETYARELRGYDGPVDLLTAGFPCQDLSVAGKRAGLSGSRSSLFYEYVRIAKTLAPTFGLVENVPGLLSSHRGRDFWTVLQGLRECWPAVAWRVLDSQHFGVPQRRRRVFLVGGPTEASVSEILALTESGGGDSAAGGEAGSRVTRGAIASTLNSGGNSGGFRTEPGEHLVTAFNWQSGGDCRINPQEELTDSLHVGQVPAIASTIKQRMRGATDEVMDNLVTHALTGEGHDASEDGTGRGTPLVCELAHHGANQTGVRSGSSYPVSATQAAMIGSTIRRLTALEAERLQGFPDGFTCLCQPLSAYAADPDAAALACRCADSPRYRALGNAVTVPVIHWLGERLRHAMVARREATP